MYKIIDNGYDAAELKYFVKFSKDGGEEQIQYFDDRKDADYFIVDLLNRD